VSGMFTVSKSNMCTAHGTECVSLTVTPNTTSLRNTRETECNLTNESEIKFCFLFPRKALSYSSLNIVHKNLSKLS